MRTSLKTFAGIAAAGSLMFSLAACSPSNTASRPGQHVLVLCLCGDAQAAGLDPGSDRSVHSRQTGRVLRQGPGDPEAHPGVVGTAALTDGSLIFPITGGKVDYYDPAKEYRPYVQGLISHAGSGFSLTAGDTKVDLTNFTIDPGTSKLYGDVAVNGTVAAKQAYIFNLDGSTLKPLAKSGDTAILEGTRVLISDTAAGLLNKTFKTDAVKADMLVGVAKITVNTK
ncbi:hypothetical protein AHiyo4_46270 [Arthrobacter sp. Hiyo4]|nr:hypothetical protein AHiyo4_46270 [Arthrobacter sp. Hiyo4]